MKTAEQQDRRPRFEPWPWVLAGLVTLMISISMSLYFVASANVDGIVGNAWESGLAFNDELAARRRAAATGASLRASVDTVEEGARVSVVVEGGEAERVLVERIRPAQAGYDLELPLEHEAGVWSAVVSLPRGGRWRFRVRAELPEGYLQRVVDLYVPSAVPGAAR